ncbi:hypothetical protein ACLB2K_011753 [Fragaria x ananassa]
MYDLLHLIDLKLFSVEGLAKIRLANEIKISLAKGIGYIIKPNARQPPQRSKKTLKNPPSPPRALIDLHSLLEPSTASSSRPQASSSSHLRSALAPIPPPLHRPHYLPHLRFHFHPSKEKLGFEANSEPKRSDPGGSEIGNDPINGVVPVEQKSPSKPISVEEGERQEEESAPPERQVSPQKLYRAALLRNRFADTIFKAKEKALLEKGDKLDPEKLRIEREELERRHKEEKARLQAEARAAEEARKKAEARRQRELEREAARQALQMMEKTVEINENSRFMEDLEMFRAGDDDHLPHYIEETSPEHSHNEPGSFKLQGSSNPLEQLGLFMKADDDIEIEDVLVVGYIELFWCILQVVWNGLADEL